MMNSYQESLSTQKKDAISTKNSAASSYEEYQQGKRTRIAKKMTIAAFIGLIAVWSWIDTGFSILSIWGGLSNIFSFVFFDMFPPDLTVFKKFLGPALDSLYMSIVGVVIAMVFSIAFGFMAATTTSIHPIAAHVFTAIISFLRSVPALVLGMFFVVTFGMGTFAGALALGISGIGILGKAYKENLEEINRGQVEALKATGASWLQIAGQAIWPQFKPGFVSWTLYKMDINIREASILGMIGAGGIGYALQFSVDLFRYQQAATAILLIFILIIIVEFITLKLREYIL
ncbi:phosphonate ABC transporter, permease protein PhnE [Cohnella sp.]|uniref:phosphonate ABC transporter, permease protein PhnE n=1 Tax=Cohnella sp. TaxID=1883426 RepID=UPI0035685EBE